MDATNERGKDASNSIPSPEGMDSSDPDKVRLFSRDAGRKIRIVCLVAIAMITFVYSQLTFRGFGDKLLPIVGFGPVRPITESITRIEKPYTAAHSRILDTGAISYSNGRVDDPKSLRYSIFYLFRNMLVVASFFFLLSHALAWIVRNLLHFEILDDSEKAGDLRSFRYLSEVESGGAFEPSATMLLLAAILAFCFFHYMFFCNDLVTTIREWLTPLPQSVIDSGAATINDGTGGSDTILRFSNGHATTYGLRRGRSFDVFLATAFTAFLVIPLTVAGLCFVAKKWLDRVRKRRPDSRLLRLISFETVNAAFGALNKWFQSSSAWRSKLCIACLLLGMFSAYYTLAATGGALYDFAMAWFEVGWRAAWDGGVVLTRNIDGAMRFSSGTEAAAETWKHGVPVALTFVATFGIVSIFYGLWWLAALLLAEALKNALLRNGKRYNSFDDVVRDFLEKYADEDDRRLYAYKAVATILAAAVSYALAAVAIEYLIAPLLSAGWTVETISEFIDAVWKKPLVMFLDWGLWLGLLLLLRKPLHAQAQAQWVKWKERQSAEESTVR